MYAASYNDEHESVPLPSGYSGTVLREENSTEVGAVPSEPQKIAEGGSLFSGLFSRELGSLFNVGIFKDFKLGSEEILIIAAAAFLIFSGNPDLECLVILIVLLFVK